MPEDIFVPTSRSEDALVGPLHTVTYTTAHKERVTEILTLGYGLTAGDWYRPDGDAAGVVSHYFGVESEPNWETCLFSKKGEGANVQIRLIAVSEDQPCVRPSYDGLVRGGATVSFPVNDLRSHEQHMAGLGVASTMGVKELEFLSPEGETYISAEIVYKAPDNVFLLGVKRPEIFVPVGPVDALTGIGGAAYSARCVGKTDEIHRFLKEVLSYEIRRDVNFVVGDVSAINLPEGTVERFSQAFAPGSSTAYLILMDHGDDNIDSSARSLGPPNRGYGMWSFATDDLDEVHRRAQQFGSPIVQGPQAIDSPFLKAKRTMLIEDPDGFLFEIFEN